MRKAMFLAGHLRGMSKLSADFMRTQFDGDVFVTTWDREDCTPDSPKIDRDEVMKTFGAKRVEIENFDAVYETMVEKYKTFEPHNHMVVCHKNRKGYDSFCMLHIWQRSWLALKAYEKEMGFKYDVVVRFRPDYVFQGLPPDFQPEPNTLHFPSNCVFSVVGACAITDNLFVADRETMEKMMLMPFLAETYLLADKCHWTHEHLVYFHTVKQGIRCKKLNPLLYRSADGSVIHGDHMAYLPYKKPNVVGTMLVKNEEDIIAECIEHSLANGVTKILLTDNGSDDRTVEIASKYPEVQILHEPGNDYQQGEWQTKMARMAYEMGAEWVVPIDADEFWEGLPNLLHVPPKFGVMLADAMYEHYPTDLIEEPFKRTQMPCYGRQVRNTFGYWGIGRMAFRPTPNIEVGMGQHSLGNYAGEIALVKEIWIHHYPIRAYERYAKKIKSGVEALIRGGHHESIGMHWREAYEKLKYGTLELDYNQRRLKMRQPVAT